MDRTACAKYKNALDAKLKERGLPPEWSDVIISEGQNDEPLLEKFHYGKQKQDDLIYYFKLTPSEWEKWNKERFGDDRSQWRALEPAFRLGFLLEAKAGATQPRLFRIGNRNRLPDADTAPDEAA